MYEVQATRSFHNGGRIIGFPASPGAAYLARGVRHKVMMTTSGLPSRYEFPNLGAHEFAEFLTLFSNPSCVMRQFLLMSVLGRRPPV
jgi:hypothetical protein